MRDGIEQGLNVTSWKVNGIHRVALMGLAECNQVGGDPLSHNYYAYAIGESFVSVDLAIMAMLDGLQQRVAVFAPTIVAFGDAKVLREGVSEEEKAWIFEGAEGRIEIMRNMVVGRGGLTLTEVVAPGDGG